MQTKKNVCTQVELFCRLDVGKKTARGAESFSWVLRMDVRPVLAKVLPTLGHHLADIFGVYRS